MPWEGAMDAGGIVIVVIAAAICGLIAIGGWVAVRRLEGGSEKHRDERELQKARKETRREQQDQHGR